MNDLLDQLNDQQRQAVEFCTGPSLVIAGAGSGKTRVLTYKIAYLLQQGLSPRHVLALTFTNKAAREMKDRIATVVGDKLARQLWMGTFHSIFSRILRTEADAIGYKNNYTIFDASDAQNLVKIIIRELQLDDKIYKPSSVINQISRAKNALISPAMYAADAELLEYDRQARRPLTARIYQLYQARLKQANSMDFDDLLMLTHALFEANPEVLAKYQNQFQYILVDEYQDTNAAQHAIVKQLAMCHSRVCVVGDDAQSIYSFRGANIQNILHFKASFPGTQIFKLEQNYRSTQTIVDAANSLIKKNREQIDKTVFSTNARGANIDVVSGFSDYEEALIVSNRIQRMHLEHHLPFSDFAILYRTNSQSRLFEDALRRNNIPHRIYGGLSFYQRKEIKDVVAYFRLMVNPDDETAFRRIINFPRRGIGDTTVQKLAQAATAQSVSLWAVLEDPLRYGANINGGTAKKLAGFREMMTAFAQQNATADAYTMAQTIVSQSGIAAEAYTDKTPEGMSRAENIKELMNAIKEFVDTHTEEGSENVGMTDFLAEVSLLTDQDTNADEATAEKVTLMTVHAAKGLEFKHVFVVGMEEDLFPSAMAKTEPNGIEEERRLLYVAITRARLSCTITYAKSRFRNGQPTTPRPSRFLSDIDARYLNMDAHAFHSTQQTNPDSFWERLRQKASPEPQRPSAPQMPPPNSVPIGEMKGGSATLSAEALALKEGDMIEHDRFGRGRVLKVEQANADRKATVEFDNSGTKMLLLKYAKFRIIT